MKNSNTLSHSISAYRKTTKEKIDPRCIPQKLKGPVPEGKKIIYPNYSQDDHDIWKFLYLRQMKFLHGKVSDEYLHGIERLNLSSEKIPSLSYLSSILKRTTQWSIARIPGVIEVEDFFPFIKRRVFPSRDFMRNKDEMDYTPVPDPFHDIFGHMPMLTDSNFASFYQKFGEAAVNANNENRKLLERFHWFTVDFGLIKKRTGLKVYGAGIVSSLNEIKHALSDEVEILDFDPERIVHQEFEPTHIQPVLFVIESFKQLEDGFLNWIKSKGLL